MPLIICEDCGKEISDRAPACPHCGAPKTARTSESPQEGSVIKGVKIGIGMPDFHQTALKP